MKKNLILLSSIVAMTGVSTIVTSTTNIPGTFITAKATTTGSAVNVVNYFGLVHNIILDSTDEEISASSKTSEIAEVIKSKLIQQLSNPSIDVSVSDLDLEQASNKDYWGELWFHVVIKENSVVLDQFDQSKLIYTKPTSASPTTPTTPTTATTVPTTTSSAVTVSSSNSGSSHHSSSGASSSSSSTSSLSSGSETTTTNSSESNSNINSDVAQIKNQWSKNADGTWSFINENGIKSTGWLKDSNGAWYYLNTSGEMATGWQNVNGMWYYLHTTGKMAIGWIQDSTNGKWYYLNNDGAMKTGWVQDISGKWYYLNSDGSMATNTIIDGYKLDSTGEWIN